MRVVEPVVELARGLWTTLKMLLEKKVTVQYPEEKKPVKTALPRPPCAQTLRERPGKMHRLCPVCGRLPG